MTNLSAPRPWVRRAGTTATVLVVLAIYGWEAQARRERVASPASQGDQGAYLAHAQQMHDSHYTVVAERNRMPVYPFLLSLIYRPGTSEAEFLDRAQTFNVTLSIFLLLLLWLVFRRCYPPLPALALVIATAFGVFLYRAGMAQTELLYYFISFGAFLLLLQMLIAPRWWLALLSGAAVGVAHLTKASVLPTLGVWAVVFLAQIFWNFRVRPGPHARPLLCQLALLLLVIATFLAVVFPYIRTSNQIYGQYFYNVNSTFIMWCDSSSEGHDFLAKYGDKDKWRELPPDQLPSAAKYWREHSISQIARRLVQGLAGVATQNAIVIGYYKYVVFLALLALFLALRHFEQAGRWIAGMPFAAAFCFFFLAAYLLLYAWYNMITRDSRFILSIFLPFAFIASTSILALAQDRTMTICGRPRSFGTLLAGGLIGLAVIDAAYNAWRTLV